MGNPRRQQVVVPLIIDTSEEAQSAWKAIRADFRKRELEYCNFEVGAPDYQ
jgi:hypothetical protein